MSFFIQCANAVIRSKACPCPYFKVRYNQIKKRRSHNKAIIAIAHKLFICIPYELEKYNIDSDDPKTKHTYAPQITEEMAILRNIRLPDTQ